MINPALCGRQRAGSSVRQRSSTTRLRTSLLFRNDDTVRPEHVWAMSGHDVLVLSLEEKFGVDVIAALFFRLFHFHRDAVRVGPGIVARARNLPRNFHVRLVGLDGELV